MRIFRFLAICGLGVMASCSSPKLVGSANVQVVPGGNFPPPTRSDLTAGTNAYLIGPFDELQIDVFGVGELSKKVQTDSSGRLSLPLAGTIEAAGMTPEELANEIENRLRGRYVRDPQVTVNLEETVSQVVTVDGEVGQPGLYPVVGRMTLMRAIATAKGTTEYARTTHVVVFREVGRQKLAALYDLRAIRQGIYEDPEVYANDVVYVGESQARRLFRDFIAASGLLITPLVAILDNN